jgi:uncharacterized protein (DUF1810 family)
MSEIHYGVVMIDGQWMVISQGLRSGPYPSEADAEAIARRMADQAAGLEVQLHLQDETGNLRLEQHGGDPPAPVQAYDIERFVAAQAPIFKTALSELRAGHKQSHWMWFVFPQLRGLGRSRTAEVYGLASREEARAYLAHATLGPRLEAAVEALGSSPARSLHAVFGSPDDLKFCSSMTLFADIAPQGPFRAALDRWCDGEPDQRTLNLLGNRD